MVGHQEELRSTSGYIPSGFTQGFFEHRAGGEIRLLGFNNNRKKKEKKERTRQPPLAMFHGVFLVSLYMCSLGLFSFSGLGCDLL